MTKHLLIVEDNEQDLELARVALESSDVRCAVSVVRDGAEALDFLYRRGAYAGRPEGHPDLVLLDLHMPRVDGHEVLCAMHEDEALGRVPVVVFTTSNLPEDREASAACGAVDHVVKPEGFEEFVTTINRLGRQWLRLEQSA